MSSPVRQPSTGVPLLDLKAQYASLKDEILAAVSEVLESQICIGGPKVAALEKQVAALSSTKFGIGVSSGTDALLNSLMAFGVGAGDEVITTPFTFFATAGAIARLGAKPVFVDIDPRTYNIDPVLIERAITKRTKAMMPVHLFGQMCDMDPIMELAGRHGLPVIEDAAQAISATYKGRPAGSIGTVGCFSFFPSKNLGGVGDGGMIVTNDEAVGKRLMLLRNHGAQPKYFHELVGGNFRLDPIQAAVLLVKLPHLNEWSEARRQKASYYNDRFDNTPVGTPWVSPDCTSIFNQYVIRVRDRQNVMNALKAKSIGHEIYYPLPMHLQKCFEYLGYKEGEFPHSESASREVLALPVYPELTREMQEQVCEVVLGAALG